MSHSKSVAMIDIENLSFGYKKKAPLFDQMSLRIQSGSITGLLGKNGTGKTTLLKIVSGLLHPKVGKVSIGNYNPPLAEASFLADLFFVPEEFSLPPTSIKDHIKANSQFYPRFDHDQLVQLLEEFELTSDDELHKLSLGQKKKYLISFALATKCKLLILDEPTNGMDIPSKGTFRKVIAGAWNEDQLILISTHQVKDVENLIDTVIMLDHSQVIMHKKVFDITAQLQFTESQHLDTDVLYSETSPNGYLVIKPQINGHSSVNLELLFNAMTKGTKLFENE